VLADDANGAFLIGGVDVVIALLRQKDRVQQSLQTGRGVPYDDLGVEHAAAEIRFTEPWMRANFVPVILPEIGVAAVLADGGRAAEIDCRSGGTSLEMAKAFPNSQFQAFETSGLCHEKALERLAASGLKNLTFHRAGAEALGPDASYDFILTWDCVHDMPDPAATMRAIRAALKPDGVWLLIDINGMPTPEENYDHPLGAGPLLYSISVLDCLALSTCDHGAALGTFGLPQPLARKMAAEAGFTRFTVRDFGKPLSAFYEIRP
jgi:SAM-dependent methyltransferase